MKRGRWISLNDVFREHERNAADYLAGDRERRLASLPPDAPDVGDGRAAGRSARWRDGLLTEVEHGALPRAAS